MKYLPIAFIAMCLLLIVVEVQTQDLDPRAYARIPVNMTFIVTGFGYSSGGVLTDPTVPTMVLPAGKRHSVKIACSRGAIIRYGADFTILSIGWQTSFFGRPVKTKSQSS